MDNQLKVIFLNGDSNQKTPWHRNHHPYCWKRFTNHLITESIRHRETFSGKQPNEINQHKFNYSYESSYFVKDIYSWCFVWYTNETSAYTFNCNTNDTQLFKNLEFSFRCQFSLEIIFIIKQFTHSIDQHFLKIKFEIFGSVNQKTLIM